MKLEILEKMTGDQLDTLAAAIGCDVSKLKTDRAKAEAISRFGNRTVTVDVAGLELSIEMGRLDDMRIAKIDAKEDKDMGDVLALSEALFGDEQTARIIEYVTEDDGRQDATLFSFIVGEAARAAGRKN